MDFWDLCGNYAPDRWFARESAKLQRQLQSRLESSGVPSYL
jgi:hypothetical protein